MRRLQQAGAQQSPTPERRDSRYAQQHHQRQQIHGTAAAAMVIDNNRTWDRARCIAPGVFQRQESQFGCVLRSDVGDKCIVVGIEQLDQDIVGTRGVA